MHSISRCSLKSQSYRPSWESNCCFSLAMWVVHILFLHKGPSVFHHSSSWKHEFVESGACGLTSNFLEDARSSSQLWEADWAWVLEFIQIFNAQLSCTGFHAPNYDWYCCPRAGYHENFLPSQSIGPPSLSKWYPSNIHCWELPITSPWDACCFSHYFSQRFPGYLNA